MAPAPFLLRTALLSALLVFAMTWVVMPRLPKLMRPWLSQAAHNNIGI